MLLNPKKELMGVRQTFMASVGQTTPAKEFGATLLMAMVGLHMTGARIRKTQNFKERREKIHEFNRQRNAIEKGIQALRKSRWESFEVLRERRKRAMP